MIPNFKTYLKESIWSDMQDRGTGDIIKREDDVNLMSVETFVKYLIKRYDFKDNYQIEYDKKLYMFSMPVLCANGVFGPDNMGVDYIKDSSEIKHMWILDSALPESVRSALKKRFELSAGSSYTFLSPLDGRKPTNQFVVDVLDYMADLNMDEINIIRVVKESIWSDMQERGTGDVIKKEDDVNLLDYDGLYDYIKSKYSGKLFYIDKEHFGQKDETICVDPIKNVSLYLKRLKDGSLEHILLSWITVNIYHPFLLKLEERFFVSSPNVMRRIIKEKDGTCTNKTYIDVIDFFLEHIDNVAVKESIWSDMQDRGTGDMVKKEDDIDCMHVDEFYNYLKDHYSLSEGEFDWMITTDSDGEPVYEIWIPITCPKNSKVGAHSYFIVYNYYDKYLTISNNFSIDFPELSKLIDDNFVMKEHPKYNENLLYIGEKETITYSFVVKVIDFIIDNIQDKRELIINKK